MAMGVTGVFQLACAAASLIHTQDQQRCSFNRFIRTFPLVLQSEIQIVRQRFSRWIYFGLSVFIDPIPSYRSGYPIRAASAFQLIKSGLCTGSPVSGR